ncbi:MAG: hypothetical protein H7Z75_00900, partial [Ferruginibacter sp.]|nr:hypothetical protein [Cytophagales bacterium]
MKKCVVLALLWLASGEVFAQKIIQKSQPFRAGQQVDLDLKFADSIRISYWDKAEVSVRIAVEINGGKLNDARPAAAESRTGDPDEPRAPRSGGGP